VVDEESLNLGVNATPQFIGSLMELVWAQIGIFQPHLELAKSSLKCVLSLDSDEMHITQETPQPISNRSLNTLEEAQSRLTT
jgi:hypothetical protein